MVLDSLNTENFNLMGGYKVQHNTKTTDRDTKGTGKYKSNKSNKSNKSRKGLHKKGGSLVADVSVPASFLLLNQFFKNKKNSKKKTKKFKKLKRNNKFRKSKKIANKN